MNKPTPIENINRKINDIIKGTGHGRVEIHIRDGKIIRTEKVKSNKH